MSIGRRTLLGFAASGVATAALGQTPPPVTGKALPPGLPQPTETIDLWPKGAPGMPAAALIETVNERSTDAQLTDRAVFALAARAWLCSARPVPTAQR